MTSRYVWVEALSGVMCLAVFERLFLHAPAGRPALHAALESLCYFAFVGGLIIATFVDLEWMEIPDEVSLPGAALGLATVGFRLAPSPLEAALGAGLGFLVVQVLFVWAYELLTGRRGMGEGDAKLLMMIGAFLGWESVLFCLVAGSVQGLVAAMILRLTGAPLVPQRPDDPRPPAHENLEEAEEHSPDDGNEEDFSNAPMMVFGPLLAVSAIEYLFFGEQLMGAYFRALGG
jgi:leader peptidase (prepilin peptidase)/N-methyltransferase